MQLAAFYKELNKKNSKRWIAVSNVSALVSSIVIVNNICVFARPDCYQGFVSENVVSSIVIIQTLMMTFWLLHQKSMPFSKTKKGTRLTIRLWFCVWILIFGVQLSTLVMVCLYLHQMTNTKTVCFPAGYSTSFFMTVIMISNIYQIVRFARKMTKKRNDVQQPQNSLQNCSTTRLPSMRNEEIGNQYNSYNIHVNNMMIVANNNDQNTDRNDVYVEMME